MTAAVNGNAKGDTFLFTSESVGEGHPDKIAYVPDNTTLAPLY
jgi:hypothetical protein